MQRATPETQLIAKADAARLAAAIAELPEPFKETLGKIAGVGRVSLERDDFSSNRHPALGLLFEHDLFGKPVPTFPDHALVGGPIDPHGLPALAWSVIRHAGKAP